MTLRCTVLFATLSGLFQQKVEALPRSCDCDVASKVAHESAEEKRVEVKEKMAMPTVRVFGSSWTAVEKKRVQRICALTIKTIWDAAEQPTIPDIIVVHDKSGPFALPGSSPKDVNLVFLSCKADDSPQIVYQVGHEFGHVLCGMQNPKHASKWFDEVICESIAMLALKTIGPEAFEIHDSASRELFDDYFDLVSDERRGVRSLSAWLKKNELYLSKNPTDYDFNMPATLMMLRYFESNPKAIACLRFLNNDRPGESFEAHLRRWSRRCPKQLRSHVFEISSLFELESERDEKTER